MKAYVLHGVDDLRYEEVAEPEIGKEWALIRVKASSVCSSDIPRIYTKGTYHFPTIPGHEFAGIVERVGDEKYSGLVGKSVGIFPLIPCKKCECCRNEQYEMCQSYDYVGSRRDGGFAEFVAVPVWNLLVLPEGIDMKEAAMLEPLSVALHAVKKLQIQPGESVAVIGTGMIGFAAAEWALERGAGRVCIVGRNLAKKAILGENSKVEYILESELEMGSFDKVLEAVGTVASICNSIRAAAAGGTVVLMGNPEGDILLPQDVYWRVLRKQIHLVGTWNSSYGLSQTRSDWEDALEAMAQKRIDVKQMITHCFKQDELVKGLEIMRTHSQVYCRVLVEWNEERN